MKIVPDKNKTHTREVSRCMSCGIYICYEPSRQEFGNLVVTRSSYKWLKIMDLHSELCTKQFPNVQDAINYAFQNEVRVYWYRDFNDFLLNRSEIDE